MFLASLGILLPRDTRTGSKTCALYHIESLLESSHLVAFISVFLVFSGSLVSHKYLVFPNIWQRKAIAFLNHLRFAISQLQKSTSVQWSVVTSATPEFKQRHPLLNIWGVSSLKIFLKFYCMCLLLLFTIICLYNSVKFCWIWFFFYELPAFKCRPCCVYSIFFFL